MMIWRDFTKEDGFLSRLQEDVKKWFIENIMPRISLPTHNGKFTDEPDEVYSEEVTIVDILNSIDDRLAKLEESISKLNNKIEDKNDNKKADKKEPTKDGRFEAFKYILGRRELLNAILGIEDSEDK